MKPFALLISFFALHFYYPLNASQSSSSVQAQSAGTTESTLVAQLTRGFIASLPQNSSSVQEQNVVAAYLSPEKTLYTHDELCMEFWRQNNTFMGNPENIKQSKQWAESLIKKYENTASQGTDEASHTNKKLIELLHKRLNDLAQSDAYDEQYQTLSALIFSCNDPEELKKLHAAFQNKIINTSELEFEASYCERRLYRRMLTLIDEQERESKRLRNRKDDDSKITLSTPQQHIQERPTDIKLTHIVEQATPGQPKKAKKNRRPRPQPTSNKALIEKARKQKEAEMKERQRQQRALEAAQKAEAEKQRAEAAALQEKLRKEQEQEIEKLRQQKKELRRQQEEAEKKAAATAKKEAVNFALNKIIKITIEEIEKQEEAQRQFEHDNALLIKLIQSGEKLLRTHKFNETLTTLEAAEKIARTNERFIQKLPLILFLQGTASHELYNGTNLEQNLDRAISCYQQCPNNGYALYNLGICYNQKAQNLLDAVSAAEKRNAHEEAEKYEKEITAYDQTMFTCFEKAALIYNIPAAFYRLAICYEEAYGTKEDLKKATVYLSEAQEKGYAAADIETVRKQILGKTLFKMLHGNL